MVVDCMRGEASAKLGRPASPPWIGVIGRKAAPMRLHRRRVGLSNEAPVAQVQKLRDPIGETILENRTEALSARLFYFGERIGLGQRAGEGLLDDDVASCAERAPGLIEVKRRWRADIHDVQIEP